MVLTGASGKKIEVLAGKLYRVKLTDNIYFEPMTTILTNLNKMNEAFCTSLDGVMGYEFLRQKRTIINYKKEKLYFINYPIFKQGKKYLKYHLYVFRFYNAKLLFSKRQDKRV